MKKVSYLEMISQDEKKIKKEQLEFKAKEAQHNVDMTILETEKKIYSLKTELEEAKRAVPYDVSKEIELVNEIEGLEASLEKAKAIREERW